jgi:predicted amidohydrolase YtcJ
MAAARSSVRCGPPDVRTAGELQAALLAAVPDVAGWIRGTGYFESVAGDLDAAALDAMRPDVPVRVQHRSGALWVLNSAALAAAGLAGHPDGRLFRADGLLRERLGQRSFPGLAAVGAQLIGHGVTAVTDATPDLDDAAISAISGAMTRGELPPRVHLLGVPLGGPLPATPGLTAGPYKIVLADSGMLTYPELAGRIAAAHEADRAVAVHCVTLEALVLLLAALRDVGTRAGDRVEHGGIVPDTVIDDLVRLGVRVVTQPGFLADRGDDFLRDLPAAEHADLYRCGSLLRAGVRVALSSDAPYGPADPWAVMAAAVSRRTESGRVAGPGERVSFGDALAAYLGPPDDPGGPPRRVAPGSPADLVVLRVRAGELPGCADPVRAVLAAGRLAG